MPESDPSTLAALLDDRDVPCPGCGYNLQGLPKAVCPECGANVSTAGRVRAVQRTIKIASAAVVVYLAVTAAIVGWIAVTAYVMGVGVNGSVAWSDFKVAVWVAAITWPPGVLTLCGLGWLSRRAESRAIKDVTFAQRGLRTFRLAATIAFYTACAFTSLILLLIVWTAFLLLH